MNYSAAKNIIRHKLADAIEAASRLPKNNQSRHAPNSAKHMGINGRSISCGGNHVRA